MGGLNEYFSTSGYSIHRAAVRRERLPECCRSGLRGSGAAVKYLGQAGENILLPLLRCASCGRMYAVCDESGKRFMPVENPLRYEIVTVPEHENVE